MIKLNFEDDDPTLAEADNRIELREAEKPKRSYLGMSAGGDCARKQYYRFYGVQSAPFEAKTLKNFRDGHRTEDLVIEDLRGVEGLTIVDRDPETGRQIEVSDFDGHFRGHLYFEVLGLKQAPKTWHVGEVKCASDKKFLEFKKAKEKYGDKQTLFNWNTTYYVQAQLYMAYRGRKRHWTVVASAGGRDWTSCRTDYDSEQAEYYINSAQRIVDQPQIIPDRISESADYYLCKWCEFNQVCHEQQAVVRHCRTCVWGEPGEARSWQCIKFRKPLSETEQAVGCAEQRYRPTFVNGQVTGIGDDFIEYETLNGQWVDRGQADD